MANHNPERNRPTLFNVRHAEPHEDHIRAWRVRPREDDTRYDPVLLAAGIKAPALSFKENQRNHFGACRAASKLNPSQRKRGAQYGVIFRNGKRVRTVEDVIVRQTVNNILNRYRRLGEVR